jgi:phage terminase small subunit
MSNELTDKQRLFVDHYVNCLNGAEAARLAGYAAVGARQEAYRLLTNADIRAEIDARLAESAMPVSETLFRLTEHARGSMADFLRPRGKGVTLDLKHAMQQGALHLVKKYSKTKQGVTIEVYDAQAALLALAKHHGLLIDRQEITGKNGQPIEVHDARSRLLDRLARRAADADAVGDSSAAGGSAERRC